MMHNDTFLFLKEHKVKATHIVDHFVERAIEKTPITYDGIICIYGCSGTGKSEIAWNVSRILYKRGICSHIINLDRFYKIEAKDRNAWRKENDYVGHKEMDWDRVNAEINRWTSHCYKVLIFEGLYASHISGMRFFIEGTPESTKEFKKLRGKENEDDEWRKEVVRREYEDIMANISKTDYTIKEEIL